MSHLMPETIETERLLLRTFKDKDWRDLHDYYSDEICTRYTIGRTLTEGESWRAMASMIGHWTLRGYGPYAVEEKSGRTVLGPVGLWYPNDWPEPEVKWGLARRFWGQGYAREAAKAVLDVAAKRIPDTSLISLIHPENTASIRLAIAVGAKFSEEVDCRDERWHVYRHGAAKSASL